MSTRGHRQNLRRAMLPALDHGQDGHATASRRAIARRKMETRTKCHTPENPPFYLSGFSSHRWPRYNARAGVMKREPRVNLKDKSMDRRDFLRSVALTAGAARSAGGMSVPMAGEPLPVPRQIKMFNIDFNWRGDKFAPPGYWAGTPPEAHVQWCESLGANVIHASTVSCNGYAWYKRGFAPPEPGLAHDFFPEMIRLARRKNIIVTGYFCVGANTKWGQDHPDLSYGTPSTIHIPLTDEYLDYLTKSISDAIDKTGMEVCTIDWLWNPGAHGTVYHPSGEPREKRWLDCEKKLFTQLTGQRFPAAGVPNAEDKLAYERLAIDHCWDRIRDARDRTNRQCALCIWMNHADDPTIAGSKVFREVDWFINENPDARLLELARKLVRKDARLIQNLGGWANHDAMAFLSDPAHRAVDLCGFAEPHDDGLPSPVEEYLRKPLSAFKHTDRLTANEYNIAVLARAYRGLPLDAVIN